MNYMSPLRCICTYILHFTHMHTHHTTPHPTTQTHCTQFSVYHDHWRREQICLLHDLVQCSKVLYNNYIYYNINNSLSIYNPCNSWAYQRASQTLTVPCLLVLNDGYVCSSTYVNVYGGWCVVQPPHCLSHYPPLCPLTVPRWPSLSPFTVNQEIVRWENVIEVKGITWGGWEGVMWVRTFASESGG